MRLTGAGKNASENIFENSGSTAGSSPMPANVARLEYRLNCPGVTSECWLLANAALCFGRRKLLSINIQYIHTLCYLSPPTYRVHFDYFLTEVMVLEIVINLATNKKNSHSVDYFVNSERYSIG